MKTFAEATALGCGMIIVFVTVFALILALSISIWAGLAMLICNWILPMFDVNYPITFLQGCGIGVVLTVIKAVFTTNVQVKS